MTIRLPCGAGRSGGLVSVDLIAALAVGLVFLMMFAGAAPSRPC